MSTENKVEDKEIKATEPIKVITKESLEAIDYHKMKEELEKIGLGSAWKGGKKKADIVKDALTKLKEVKDLQKQGKTQEEIDAALALTDSKKQQEKDDAEAERLEQERLDQEGADTEAVEKAPEFTLEQLEKALVICQANLKRGPKGHRNILLKQKAKLKLMIEAKQSED